MDLRPEVCYLPPITVEPSVRIDTHSIHSRWRERERSLKLEASACAKFRMFLLITSTTALLTACQSLSLVTDQHEELASTSVMELWGTYKHCRSSVDPHALQADARQLNVEAEQAMVVDPSPIPLPGILRQRVDTRPPRFSVDPLAMAASCSLYAGDAALKAGQNELAAEMFRLVLRNPPHTDYGYYLSQAREGLREAESTTLVSTPTEPRFIQTSSPLAR